MIDSIERIEQLSYKVVCHVQSYKILSYTKPGAHDIQAAIVQGK